MAKFKVGTKVEVKAYSCSGECRGGCKGSMGRIIETPTGYKDSYGPRIIAVRFSPTSWCMFKPTELKILK